MKVVVASRFWDRFDQDGPTQRRWRTLNLPGRDQDMAFHGLSVERAWDMAFLNLTEAGDRDMAFHGLRVEPAWCLALYRTAAVDRGTAFHGLTVVGDQDMAFLGLTEGRVDRGMAFFYLPVGRDRGTASLCLRTGQVQDMACLRQDWGEGQEFHPRDAAGEVRVVAQALVAREQIGLLLSNLHRS